MELKELEKRSNIDHNKKLIRIYSQFKKILTELNKRALSDKIVNYINSEIDTVNSTQETEKELTKQIIESQSNILKLVNRELKLVPKNHYLTRWLVMGIGIFGVPIGVVIGVIFDNMGLIGIGLSIGMSIGVVIGIFQDKRALNEGKQLNLEIRF